MSETFKPTPADHYGAGNGNGYKGSHADETGAGYENTGSSGSSEVGKTLLIGVLGGVLSAAGYLVYQRLPEEQKEKLHGQVKQMLQQRINEIRQNFNI